MKTLQLLFSIMLAWAAHVSSAQASPLDAARAQWAEYGSAKQAQSEAETQGDAKATQEQNDKARQALSKAVNLFREAGAGTSTDPAVRAEYVVALQTRGDYDWAAEVLKGSTALEPNRAALWREYGQVAFMCGTALKRDAVPALKKALELDGTAPEAVRTHNSLGDIYFDQALYALARQQYEAALALQPDDTAAHIGHALTSIQAGNLAAGSQEIDALGEAAKDFDVPLRVRLRPVLADFDRWSKVEDTLENHKAYCRLTYRAGRPIDTLLAAERVLKLEPANINMLNFVGAICGQVGNLPQARSAYAKSLEIKPDQPDIRETLGELDKAIAAATAPPSQ